MAVPEDVNVWAWLKLLAIGVMGALLTGLKIIFAKRESERDKLISSLEAKIETQEGQKRTLRKAKDKYRSMAVRYKAERDLLKREIDGDPIEFDSDEPVDLDESDRK